MSNKQKPKQRSDNPFNEECSPCKQALLDLLAKGFPVQSILDLLDSKEYQSKLFEADTLFNSHMYPDDKLTFFQGTRDIQLTCFLSANELKILYLMIQNMRKGNAIELSISDIKEYADISDKTATKVMSDLKAKGCIAIQFNRTKTRGTVYMVNPMIAVVGKNINRSGLQSVFWSLTGSHLDKNDNKFTYTKSKPQREWEYLTNSDKDKYSRGHDCQEFEGSKIYFNKLNEPNIKNSPDCQSDEQA